ncbi:hypothetical protein REMIM1_PE00190 (plasmid) [Rhizobium etli bv. mimosae str. Mim1]|nr:hypothetical protein REMIM1_PE00190 [Rhizobium etli bv. mimosae str. Mim1]
MAVPISPTDDEIQATKRHLDNLLEQFDACRSAAKQAQNSSDALELIDQCVKAGTKVLEFYASLPPHVAGHILSDIQARRIRDEVLDAAEECNTLATPTIYALEKSRKSASAVLDRMSQSNTSSDQLGRAVSSVANRYVACVEWWGKKALRSERMQTVCAATAKLPTTTAEIRQAEEAVLRLHSGWALHTKCMHLQSQVALARVMVEPHAKTFEPAKREIVMAENGQVRLLGTFIEDVFPAFVSTSDAVLRNQGRSLDAVHCSVLEGVMKRLSEFALALHELVSRLSDAGCGADLPLELLGQIVEGARLTAHDVMRLLDQQPKTAAITSPAVQTMGAKPTNTMGEALVAEGTRASMKGKGKGKGKGKSKPVAVAVSSALDRTQSQVTTTDKATAPAAQVVVLSDLGTKKFVSAEEISATSPWRAPVAIPLTPEGEASREESSLRSDVGPWRSDQASRSSHPDALVPRRQTAHLDTEKGERHITYAGAQNVRGTISENLLNDALDDIRDAGDIAKFSCAVVYHGNKLRDLKDQADYRKFLQTAAVQFTHQFVQNWERDIGAGESWGYATVCTAVSREAGGRAGIDACKAMAAQVSRVSHALNEVEANALSLLVLSFSRHPRLAECREGTIVIAEFFRNQHGVLRQLDAQGLALLVNGLSKWPEQTECREATVETAGEVLRRANAVTGLADFSPQNLANLLNGFSKRPETAECRRAICSIGGEVRNLARQEKGLSGFKPQELGNVVNGFSKLPDQRNPREAVVAVAGEISYLAGQEDRLSGFSEQGLAILVNGFSKWPEDCRAAMVAIASEVCHRANRLSDFNPQHLANLVNGFSKWPEDCRGALLAVADEVRHRANRANRLSDFNPQILTNLVNGFSKLPKQENARNALIALADELFRCRPQLLADFSAQGLANLVNGFSKCSEDCHGAVSLIAGEVHGRAIRHNDRLSKFISQDLSDLVNGFSKWPAEAECRDAIGAIACEVVARADRLSTFTHQHLAILVNGFSKLPNDKGCGEATAVIADEVLRCRANMLSRVTHQHLSHLVNGFSKWPEGAKCRDAAAAIADEVCRRADRENVGLSDFIPQDVAMLVNGFSKWPQEENANNATAVIGDEVCRRADRENVGLSDFIPQDVVMLVNGFSKQPELTNGRRASIAIGNEILRQTDRRNAWLSDFSAQEMATLVNGFSKWPQEDSTRQATIAIGGEVCRRAGPQNVGLLDFDARDMAILVNGFSKWPQEENTRQATVAIGCEVCRRANRPNVQLSDFTPQHLANLANGFSKFSEETGCRDGTIAIADEVLCRCVDRADWLSHFDAQGVTNLLNGFSRWPEACQQAIVGIARGLGTGGLRFSGFTTPALSTIANGLARAVMQGQGEDSGEITQAVLLKDRLHQLAHYLHYATDRLEQADTLDIANILKALAKAQLFDDLGLVAQPGLVRLSELRSAPDFELRINLETMGNLCVALLPLARSPRKQLRWQRGRAIKLLNDLQPVVERKVEAHLRASDAGRTSGTNTGRCPALSIYQVLKTRAVLETMYRRPYVEGERSALRRRQKELHHKTKEILDSARGLIERDLSNMSWNVIAEIESETPVDALDTFMAQNAATVQAQNAPSVFDVHQVLRAMDHDPRPPRGEAGLMRLPVVDMQGRQLAIEPELRYSIFHRLTSGAVKVVAVQLPGRPSAFMLARTLTVNGVPYRMDLFGGSKLKAPPKSLDQIDVRIAGGAEAAAPGGKLLAIPYAETAPGTAFEQLSRAWAPFQEAYWYTQRRGFAAPPAIRGLGPHDYALEGAFRLSLLPDRSAGAAHPFRLTGPTGPIALRPHDGCGFIKASLAERMPAIRWVGEQRGPDRVRAYGEGSRSSVPTSALQHYQRSEPVAQEAREKAANWLASRQGHELGAKDLFRAVTAGHIDGPGAIAVPSGDEFLHVPTLKSETLASGEGVLIGRSPYDKANLRPFAAASVRSAPDGDATAAFLDKCLAIQYSFNVAQKSGATLVADDPTFFAKGILIVVPDEMWPAEFAERGVVMSAEDVKCHSHWTQSKDRVKADTSVDCVGILKATEVFAPGSLVAVPTDEQKKLDGDFDGDTVIIVGDRPKLYEHVRQFDQQEQARGIRSLKPLKSHTPAIENGRYQFSRSRQILAATQDVLETYSCLQRNFLAQTHEGRHWFAARAVFGTYEGVHHELKRDIRTLLNAEQIDAPGIRNVLGRARQDNAAARHPVAREMAALLVAELEAWAAQPEDVNKADPAVSTAAGAIFPELTESYPASSQPRDRVEFLLDRYPARIDPRPDGYNADDLVESANNLLTLGIKVGSDAYKSDTGARLFMKKASTLQRLLQQIPELKSVPYVKGVATTISQGRFDAEAALQDLKDNPTLAASVMEASIKVAVEKGILTRCSDPSPSSADLAILTREEASKRATIEAARAKEEEDKITKTTREIAGILGEAGTEVKMPHLEHRLRSEASMRDELTGTSVPSGSARQLITNAVRHIFECPDGHFTRAFKRAVLAFEERGYTEVSTTNWFRQRTPTFIGIQTVLATPEGYRFEVEFHTPGSYQAKLANHDTYKQLDRLRRHPESDGSERAAEIVQRARDRCKDVGIPHDVRDILHWGAEEDRRSGPAAFKLRTAELARQREPSMSPEATEIVAALGARPVVLVGMPGSGKSTIGPVLAKRLGLKFHDTDNLIEANTGSSPSEHIDQRGEEYFRDLESKAIAELLKRGPAVIATGGGGFIRQQNRSLIGEKAVSIWLNAKSEVLEKRLRKDASRPLLRGSNREERLRKLFNERKEFYEQADLTIVPSHKQDRKEADPCVKALHVHLCGNAAAQHPSDTVEAAK